MARCSSTCAVSPSGSGPSTSSAAAISDRAAPWRHPTGARAPAAAEAALLGVLPPADRTPLHCERCYRAAGSRSLRGDSWSPGRPSARAAVSHRSRPSVTDVATNMVPPTAPSRSLRQRRRRNLLAQCAHAPPPGSRRRSVRRVMDPRDRDGEPGGCAGPREPGSAGCTGSWRRSHSARPTRSRRTAQRNVTTASTKRAAANTPNTTTNAASTPAAEISPTVATATRLDTTPPCRRRPSPDLSHPRGTLTR